MDSTRDRILIATSRYAAGLWASFLDVDVATVHVVHPFAEPVFGIEPRPASTTGRRRVLYAGRLSPEKGIYTFLSMLHTDLIEDDPSLFFTVTTAGADKPQGHIIESMLRAHPRVDLVAARTTPSGVAALMAMHDIVVMPSNGQYWHETFGIVSIEAQHAGARVVASTTAVDQRPSAELCSWSRRTTPRRWRSGSSMRSRGTVSRRRSGPSPQSASP